MFRALFVCSGVIMLPEGRFVKKKAPAAFLFHYERENFRDIHPRLFDTSRTSVGRRNGSGWFPISGGELYG